MNIYNLVITVVVNYFRIAEQGSEVQVTRHPIPSRDEKQTARRDHRDGRCMVTSPALATVTPSSGI